LWRLADRRA